MKRYLWMTVALIGAAAAGHAGAAPAPSGGSQRISVTEVTGAIPNVLHDQMDHDAGSGVSSQEFEAAMNTYNSLAADDFTIPPGQTWTLTGVDAGGQYYSGPGPAGAFNVYFFADEGGVPGPTAGSATGLAYADADNGSPLIEFASPIVLSAGTYWIALQARQDFSPAGQWAWQYRAARSGNGPVWKNPGGGFGSGCSYWQPLATCVAAASGVDLMFRLRGTKTGGRSGARWDFDEAATPALPQDWTTDATGAGESWLTQATWSASPPNAAFAPTHATTGEASLYSPSLRIGADAVLEFRHRLDTESHYDGGVLEISIDGGAFEDIESAGGRFLAGGYNDVLLAYSGCAASPNPLANRAAWSGAPPAAISTVALPAAAAGHSARFRWRLANDCSVAASGGGWWVDSVMLSDGLFCGGFERGESGSCAGHAARVFDSRAAFLAQLAPGYYEETFDDVPVDVEILVPLDYSNGAYSFTVFTQHGTDRGLVAHGGLLAANYAGDRVHITFHPPVRAIGGHFWASNAGWTPSGTTAVLTLSDGTVEAVRVTTATTFRGVVTSSPITTLTIETPYEAPWYVWPVLDDLIAGTPN